MQDVGYENNYLNLIKERTFPFTLIELELFMKNEQLRYGIYLSYISLFVTNVTNLILTPFIIRNLGQSEYGLYMLIGAFVGYIAILDFGLGNTTIRFIAKYRAENDKKGEDIFIFSTLILYLLLSFIVLIIGSLIYFNLDIFFDNTLSIDEINIAKTMFIILIINLVFTLPMNLFTGIITGYERFIFPRLVTISRMLIRFLVILLLLSLGYKSVAIVLVDAIFNLFLLLLYLGYVLFNLKIRIKFQKINKSVIKEIFSFSFLVFISVVVDQIYWRIGHLILGLIASTSEVAIFAIGMIFGQYFITFSTAISSVFLPKITKMVVNEATGEELTDLLIKTGRLQFLILGVVLGGFILFGDKFIRLWAGSNFHDSWIVALLVMCPLLIVLTQTLGISILQAKNKHGFRAIMYLCISFVNIFISIYLAKKYGSIGAALGTTLSLVLGNIIVMNYYYHFKVGLNILRFYKELSVLIIVLIASVILSAPLTFINNHSWSNIILQCIIYLVIYLSLMWFFGMNKFEKTLFSNEIRKLKIYFHSN